MKKKFTRKPYSKFLYKWSPDEYIVKNINKGGGNSAKIDKPYFCNAIPRSQGEDWITTYCYEAVNVDGEIKRIAYVACDYTS